MDNLIKAADALLFLTFWVGVPCSLLSMLLVLGFRLKNRFTTLLGALGIAGIACGPLSLTLQGIVSGDALSISRHWGLISKAQDSEGYWTATAFWLIVSVGGLGASCWMFISALRRPNIPVNPDAPRPLP
jgi:hypothetical protein